MNNQINLDNSLRKYDISKIFVGIFSKIGRSWLIKAYSILSTFLFVL